MKFTEQSSFLVKPNGSTWSGSIPLTELDQVSGNYFIPLLWVYKSPQNKLPPRHEVFELLKKSLSKVLVPFYMLAGRLVQKPEGALCIECNAAGVKFVEAMSEVAWDDLREEDYEDLVPDLGGDPGVPSLENPLMGVKVTALGCGSVCVGGSMWHPAADGLSAAHFYNEWARIARGEEIQRPPFIRHEVMSPVEDEMESLPPVTCPVQFGDRPTLINSDPETEMNKPTSKIYLEISKTQVEALKRFANEGVTDTYKRGFSRFESITAHVWKCLTRARGLKPEQPTRLLTPVDVRQRMEPKLPMTFLGNAIIDVVALELAGDVVSKPLSYTTSRIREAIKKVTPEYINESVRYLKSLDNLTSLHDEKIDFTGNPNVEVTSWLTLSFKGIDFGWGKEACQTPTSDPNDGDCLVIPGGDGSDGSVQVAICIQQEHVERFRDFFYEDIREM